MIRGEGRVQASALFISPFGLGGVTQAQHLTGFEADCSDDDEGAREPPASAPPPGPAGPPAAGSPPRMLGAFASATAATEVKMKRTQSCLALQTEGGLSPDSPDEPCPVYEKEIRRAEAHLPGMSAPNSRRIKQNSSTVGEKICKAKAQRDAKRRSGGDAGSEGAGETGPARLEAGGKDGWGVLSRNFAVSSALSSLNKDLKTFGTKPQEAAIDRERAEMEETARRCMMTPGGTSHIRYSWLNVVLLVWCAFSIPVRVSFDFHLSPFMSIVEFVIDVFFMVDVCVNFRVGYIVQEDGEEPAIVMQPGKVAKHYLKTWFVIDVVSAAPINFLLGQETLGGANRLPRLIRIPKLIRLMRLVRLLRLVKLLKTASVIESLSSAGMHPRLVRAVRLVFVTLIGSHVVACCWHFLHTLATADDPEVATWWNAYCQTALPMGDQIFSHTNHTHAMCEVDLSTRYCISLYWAVTTLTTIGFGDIVAVTHAEYIYTIFCMYVGVSFYAYIAANVATVLASLDTNTQMHNQKMDKLNEFLKATKMPSALRTRLRKYFSLYWTQQGALMPYDTRKLIEEINLPALRSEVTVALYKETLNRVPFLKNREPTFVTNMVTKFVPLHVLGGELVVREGEVGMNLFFLFNGKIESVYRERKLKYMVPGSYFGDVAVLLTERHLVSFRAHGICDLYILSKSDLEYALQHFPNYTLEMRELAVTRLAMLNEDIEMSQGRTRIASSELSGSSPEPEPERSSALSEMFEERLSERTEQILPADADARTSSRSSRSSSNRRPAVRFEDGATVLTVPDDQGTGGGLRPEMSDEFLRRFLEEEEAAGEESPSDNASLDEAAQPDKTPPRPGKAASKTVARGAAGNTAPLKSLLAASDAEKLRPEQQLAVRVIEAAAAYRQFQDDMGKRRDAIAGLIAGMVAEARSPESGSPEANLLTSVEEAGDEEEEEEEEEDEERAAKQLPSANLGAALTPSVPAGKRMAASRGQRLRRKDTAARGALHR